MSNSSREGGLSSQQSTRRRFLSGAGKAAAAAGVALGVPVFLEACATGTGTASTTPSAKDLSIGYAIGESGLLLPYDVPVADMGQLAIDDLNAKGGILGTKCQR